MSVLEYEAADHKRDARYDLWTRSLVAPRKGIVTNHRGGLMKADVMPRLVALLAKAFQSPARLERFLRYSMADQSISWEFPSEERSIHDAAAEVADELRRRGLLDSVFFERLEEQAPKWTSEVEELRSELLVDIGSWTTPPADQSDVEAVDIPTVFISYSRRDSSLYDELATHLSVLKRRGSIELLEEGRISAGERWDEVIERQLARANIILMLVSPDFLASDFIMRSEMQVALTRHEAGQALVIPVILRPCFWRETAIAQLQALPLDGIPVIQAVDTDRVWVEVVQAVAREANRLRSG